MGLIAAHSVLSATMLGVLACAVVYAVVRCLVALRTPGGGPFLFEQKPDGFKHLLATFLDILKFVMGMASAGIALVISASLLGSAHKLPATFAPPLILLAGSIAYGSSCMLVLTLDYESFCHNPVSYARSKYIRNQALGFSTHLCFLLGYLWLIAAALRR